MSIQVESDWWKSLFDEVYLMTDARSVCDDALTEKEVALLCDLVSLKPGHNILDLCGGQGRHSLALSRRGFSNCTVFDYSDTLLRIGAREAEQLNLPVKFVQGDARNIQLPSASFHHVMILGNSLGYAGSTGNDLQILREAHRLLGNGCRLVVDVTDGAAVRKHFNPNAWHEIGDDIVVCRQREIKASMICAREMVINKRSGILRDRTYGMHLYEAASLEALVTDAGFSQVRLHQDFTPYRGSGDVGFMNHRMIATALKMNG
jgi:D-alanine-D-alanine ligase